MRGEWNTQYIAVSPIRGGSLLAVSERLPGVIRFPHTRGKFTCRSRRKNRSSPFPPYAGEVYYTYNGGHIINSVSPIRGGSLPMMGTAGKFLGVSPIRGGSLPRYAYAIEKSPSFPHTRGKFTAAH